MFLKWNPLSEDVQKIPKDMWPLYYRMYNFTMYQEYERLYKPQAELIASIINPDHYKTYAEVRNKEQKIKEENKPRELTISTPNSVKSAAQADVYFDPTRGLVDFNGKVLITKEEYLKRSNSDGMLVSF